MRAARTGSAKRGALRGELICIPHPEDMQTERQRPQGIQIEIPRSDGNQGAARILY